MEIRTDFLVIGSGIAGLSFALNAAKEGSVAIITKKAHSECNTNYAQGGIATVISPDDSFDLHIQDTLTAGAGLCHLDSVELIVREGPRMVKNLMRLGVEFTKKPEGALSLGREGGHSKNRIVHAADLTGHEIEHVLGENVQANDRIAVYENHIAIDLITEHHLLRIQEEQREHVTCWGAYALDTDTGQVKKFLAKVVLLCTGGAGQVYLHTTNPKIATGDGIAMVYRAGGTVGNLEFMQFHPTSLYHPDGQSFLISEAVRGYGGVLITRKGEPFMERYHEMASLAPRDIVARAIDHEMKRSGDPCVYLDVTKKNPEETRERFPNIFQKCLSLGIDLTQEPIPVVPAAHYMCGGVQTDMWGRTAIQGLYACGEVAFTGVHGANRLASNSLLEALVFSERAYQDAKKTLRENRSSFPDIPEWNEEGTFNTAEWVIMSHDREEIQRLMWDYVGIVRSNFRLRRAQRRIRLLSEEVEAFYRRAKVTNDLIELRNLVAVAELIIRSALMRKESRGLHYTTDYPERDDRRWKRDTTFCKGDRRK
ncbi:MAG: L-aspartate oxidase [Candidatus Latescibacterota bacterium]|nr:MAG: L-aspartate oxidase [Candidatus Latescibacteria bacterium 4484_107]RKY71915.1 MAG: L-aspartate oxidase [Candidatus Latescibacterota bacterium]